MAGALAMARGVSTGIVTVVAALEFHGNRAQAAVTEMAAAVTEMVRVEGREEAEVEVAGAAAVSIGIGLQMR